MKNYWPDPQTEPTEATTVFYRRTLVARFNEIVGAPGEQELAFQAAFIDGKVSYDDAVSYVRFAEYMVSTRGTEVSGQLS